jgi:hypothetical protein
MRLSEAYRTLNGLTLRLGQEWDSCELLVSVLEVINIYLIAGGTQVAMNPLREQRPMRRVNTIPRLKTVLQARILTEVPTTAYSGRSLFKTHLTNKSCNSVMPPLSTITANSSTMWL